MPGSSATQMRGTRISPVARSSVASATRPGGPKAAPLPPRLAEPVGNRIVGRVNAVEGDAVAPVLALVAHGILESRHLVAGLAVMEGDELALGIETAAQIMHRQRVEA